MGLSFLLKGIILGFSIAAPVGPIGVLCIRRTIAEGKTVGLISGLGAASADAIYGFIAAFGLTAISLVLVNQHRWIQLVGGLFLLYLGIKTLMAKPKDLNDSPIVESNLIKSYTSTFFLTLTNPMTILSFIAVFAGLGIAGGKVTQSALTVLGVFIGSAFWWFLLSSIVSLVRNKLNTMALKFVNVCAGVIIIVFSLLALVRVIG